MSGIKGRRSKHTWNITATATTTTTPDVNAAATTSITIQFCFNQTTFWNYSDHYTYMYLYQY